MATAPKPAPEAFAPHKSVSVAEAKAHLSSLLKGVESKHSPITIHRRGKPIAQIIPFPEASKPSLLGSMRGTGRILGDIVTPYMDEWTVDAE